MPVAVVEALCEESRRFLDGVPYWLLTRGEFVESAGGHTFETIDPATDEAMCEVAHAGIKALRANPR